MRTIRAFVVGGTGFVGCNLVRRLASTGREVTVFLRSTSIRQGFDEIALRQVVGDLEDEDVGAKLVTAMRRQDEVYNLAGNISHLPKDEKTRNRINAVVPGIVADAALEVGASLVHVSSTSAIAFPKDEVATEATTFNASDCQYSVTKLAGDNAVFNRCRHGLRGIVCNIGSAIGSRGMHPHQRAAIQRLARGRMPIYPPGGLCLVHVDDIANGLILAMEKGRSGERYILGGDNITYGRYFTCVAETADSRKPFFALPPAVLLLVGTTLDLTAKFIGVRIGPPRETMKIICQKNYYSSEKARRELGYTFMSHEQAIGRTVRELGLAKSGGAGGI